jgi:hypothetical protein
MAIIPSSIPVPSSPNIASYDYTDLAEGTGIVKYYLFSSYNTALDYHLGQSQVYSNSIEFPEEATTNTSFEKTADVDFDLTTFNLPKDIKGTAYLNIAVYERGTNDVDNQSKIIAKLRHWDGTTETEIASGEGEPAASSTATDVKMNNIPIVIATKKHFKKGETLRLTIELWMKANSGDTSYGSFGIDPQNRDGTYITPSSDATVTTAAAIYIPFKLNV